MSLPNKSRAQSIPIDPRESMKQAFPDWMQPLLTRVTAKPYQGEPIRKRTVIEHFVTAFLALFVGIALSSSGVALSSLAGLALVPLGWVLTLHGAHKLHLTIRHADSHSAVSGNRKLDDHIGNAISILTISLNYMAYKERHLRVHHAARLLKPGDGTYEFLINTVGLKPGMKVSHLWRKVLVSLVSPRIHLRTLLERIMDCFLSNDTVHNTLAALFWGAILTGVHLTHLWIPFLVVWVIPITILFNWVTALRLFVEHRWPHPKYRNVRHREALAEMTAAIFFGDPAPQNDGSISDFEMGKKWAMWWIRFLGYHLPARALVLPGDAPCHDYHHRRPMSTEWTHAPFARQRDVDEGCTDWPKPYIESWGLDAAIHEVLVSLSKQSPSILKER